jgi:AcrR family transcriptional regulator
MSPSEAQRVDAARNRARLLESALEAFTRAGLDASLEGIARAAGVGIGTLYRHFPTREALVVAVYEREVEQLAASAPLLLDRLGPLGALSAWMEDYVDYVATKRGLANVLRPLADSDAEFYAATRTRTLASLGMLISAGVGRDVIRADIEPADVYRAMNAVCLAAPDTDWSEQSKRLLRLLLDGLRFRAPPD